MAAEWPQRELSELCVFLNRGATPAYVERGGMLVLGQRCVRDQRVVFSEARRTDGSVKPVSADRVLRPLDILVNSTGVGTLGRVAQIRDLPEPATVDSHLTIVRPDPDKIEPLFLGFAVRRFQASIEMLAEGSTGQTELSRARLGSVVIPTPPEHEQCAIADILSAIDDKIDLNRQMGDTLESIARALFKSWFVDFDPVRAKSEGRDPALPPEIADLFPDRFEACELGKIPAGWHVATLDGHLEVAKGLSYNGSGLSESGVPLHNLDSIYEGGGYKYQGMKYYRADFADRHVVQPGDVIVANTEQGHDRLLIGFAAVVPKGFGSVGIFTHHLYRLRVGVGSPLTHAFLYHMLNTRRMHDVVSRYANGTTVNMLPLAGLRLPKFVLPPKALVDVFHRLAALTRDRQEELNWENRTLSTLLGALLPRLISGELRTSGVPLLIDRTGSGTVRGRTGSADASGRR